ncbi:hypothetical protein CTA1_8554 [Colletotrichum tanaceti]|uniref:Uncharacterized protein n=1 Tax=Colletotrichum tanaceti TaxID=1306861 RepID=A0A4U6XNU2_9PEZI|nr:hypothetical protein CTA1_8554 [Colletotrichum tanaceti]
MAVICDRSWICRYRDSGTRLWSPPLADTWTLKGGGSSFGHTLCPLPNTDVNQCSRQLQSHESVWNSTREEERCRACASESEPPNLVHRYSTPPPPLDPSHLWIGPFITSDMDFAMFPMLSQNISNASHCPRLAQPSPNQVLSVFAHRIFKAAGPVHHLQLPYTRLDGCIWPIAMLHCIARKVTLTLPQTARISSGRATHLGCPRSRSRSIGGITTEDARMSYSRNDCPFASRNDIATPSSSP